jgi:hypothetical protein
LLPRPLPHIHGFESSARVAVCCCKYLPRLRGCDLLRGWRPPRLRWCLSQNGYGLLCETSEVTVELAKVGQALVKIKSGRAKVGRALVKITSGRAEVGRALPTSARPLFIFTAARDNSTRPLLIFTSARANSARPSLIFTSARATSARPPMEYTK